MTRHGGRTGQLRPESRHWPGKPSPGDILLAILAELEAAGESLPVRGVPYLPRAWAGRSLSSKERQACSRAARRLARYGLAWRMTQRRRDRVTHLLLTEDGLREALRLADGKADLTAVRNTLHRVRWGRSLAKALKRSK